MEVGSIINAVNMYTAIQPADMINRVSENTSDTGRNILLSLNVGPGDNHSVIINQNSFGDSVELSPDAIESITSAKPCETCMSRKYVDQSDDPSVSFQTPKNINPNMSATVVAAHEQEHVSNNRREAERNDREIVNQSVTLHYDTCSECGKLYVSGGTTRTTTMEKSNDSDEDNTHSEDKASLI